MCSKRLSTMASNSSLVSLTRRQARSGVGLTIRKVNDAHELIMGSPDPHGPLHPPRTSSLVKPRKSSLPLAAKPLGHYDLTSPSAIAAARLSAARAIEPKKHVTPPGERFLGQSLQGKPSMIPSANNNSVRSYTPSGNTKSSRTFSGTTTTMSKSITVTSLKQGLKSRFSEIFSSRRRVVSTSAISDSSKGYTTIDDEDEEEDIILEADFDSPQPTPAKDDTAIKNETPTKVAAPESANDLITKSASDNIRGDKISPSAGALVDREHPAREQQRHARGERRARIRQMNARLASATPAHTRRTHRVRRDGDDTPSPPRSRDGTAGHYTEGGIGEDDEEEQVEHAETAMSEAELDRYLEDQLNAAEDYLREAVGAANVGPNDQAAGVRVEAVISALGESIIAARTAHIAGIRLRVATANLIQDTTQRAADVRGALLAASGAQTPDATSSNGTT
jgi:hypothetical protein